MVYKIFNRKTKELDDEGGYPVPDHIAIQLYRSTILKLLSDRAKLNHVYYFNTTGFKRAIMNELDDECISCSEGLEQNECPQSKRVCGHHCNHSWSHDQCCWCGKEFGEES